MIPSVTSVEICQRDGPPGSCLVLVQIASHKAGPNQHEEPQGFTMAVEKQPRSTQEIPHVQNTRSPFRIAAHIEQTSLEAASRQRHQNSSSPNGEVPLAGRHPILRIGPALSRNNGRQLEKRCVKASQVHEKLFGLLLPQPENTIMRWHLHLRRVNRTPSGGSGETWLAEHTSGF